MKTDDDRQYYLAFSHCLGIGRVKLALLLSQFSSVKAAYEADGKQLTALIGQKTAQNFIAFRCKFDPVKKLDELRHNQIDVLIPKDAAYPPLLKPISDPPICLYVRGDLEHFQLSQSIGVAVVGTRRPSTYGSQIARQFAADLAQLGLTVVSGMAIGIDALAHWGALTARGKTIAVLGCGVDIVYPPSNRRLYDDIVRTGNLVISEFPPGHTVQKGLFVARNRIIAGLSRGVLVIEGLKDSGSLITARYAAEQGREVFAPPIPLTSSLSEAPNILLKQGATFVTGAHDIVEALNLRLYPKKDHDRLEKLSADEKTVVEILKVEMRPADQISQISQIPIAVVLNVLSNLEIKGIVTRNQEGKYQLAI